MTKFLKKYYLISIAALCLLALALTACNGTLYDVSKNNTGNTKSQIEAVEQAQYPRPPSVVEEEQPYVDVTPVSLNHPPSWYSRRISLHGNNLPLSFYISQITSGTGVLINYAPDIQASKLISVEYSGTVKGALDYLSNKSDYYYYYDKSNHQLEWSGLETKIFDVSFMPGSSQYQLGQSGGGGGLTSSGSSSSSSSSSSSGSSSTGSTGYDFSQDTQFSSTTGTLSIWDDLTTTINNLLSKDGTATVSQSTTTVTVHDHPQNIISIGRYINKMNSEMSRQVRIHVQVLAVQLSKSYSEGINWNLVKNTGSNKFNLTGDMASNAGNTGSFSPVGIAWAVSGTGSLAGTNMLIQALQQQGSVSKISEPTVTTLNNQVATIALQTQEGYISGYSSGSVSTGVSALPSPTLSTLVTGFNLYLLPKIQGQRVYLQISTILSDLVSLQAFNAQTGQPVTSGSSSSSSGSSGSTSSSSGSTGTTVIQTPQTVQEPLVDYRSFNQRTMIPNGATLILAGFKENDNSADRSKFLNSTLLGGSGATTGTIEVIVLITPTILSTTGNTLYNTSGVE